MDDEQVRASISAVTVGFVELCSILGQRGVIDAGDLQGIETIMLHALRPQGEFDQHQQARTMLATWFGRAKPLAPESIPLPTW